MTIACKLIAIGVAFFLWMSGVDAATAQQPCVGDCNGNGQVSINELISCVNIGIGRANLATCPICDGDGGGQVEIGEVITAVNIGLGGLTCAGGQTPIPISTPDPDFVPTMQEFAVPSGARPHDVAPAPDGGVWYTAQRQEALGHLDPVTGVTRHIHLGAGAAPHGVIVGPDGAPWITDGGLNAIVRVDPVSEAVQVFPLPGGSANANLNTATFDNEGVLWFTGQNGVYGRLDPDIGQVEAFASPRGGGPYGIATTPGGDVYYASLAGSYVGFIDRASRQVVILEPPTAGQGARRVWSDSQGRIWVSEWNAGQLARYDPADASWQEWPLPDAAARPYAVYVDDTDIVWLSDFRANAMVRFDPDREDFEVFELPSNGAAIRQILGRPGEVWGAESGTDKLVVIRTR